MTKLIRVRDSVYEELANYGKWQETMSDIIARLLRESARTGFFSSGSSSNSINGGTAKPK